MTSKLLKDIYSKSFYDHFSKVLNQSLPNFDSVHFKKLVFIKEFKDYELKQRMTHTALCLHQILPVYFPDAVESIKQIITRLRAAGIKEDTLEFMFFPEYIALYGIDDYKNSIAAFEFITQFTSCEFAVRPYLVKYQEQMLAQMQLWSLHKNNSVRRLASEGSRPRLPWAMALPDFKKNPSPLLAILHNLKQDNCEIVRRSVANNLNDISKDNPGFTLKVTSDWLGLSADTDALLKHACRTLLKQSNTNALKLFGFDNRYIKLSGFAIHTTNVRIGEKLAFSFNLHNTSDHNQKTRLEYVIYYLKKNGTLSRKVFKISERELEAGNSYDINRQQNFKLITTRVFYTGIHKLAIIINGQESHTKNFELVD